VSRCRGSAHTHAHITHTHTRNKMVQISRIFLRRVPSITFPVRMIDGVRVTGSSSSGKKNVKVVDKKASSSSSFSKAPPVISEEECEIVNVSSVSLTIVVVLSRLLLLLLLLFLRLLPGKDSPKVRASYSSSSPSLSLFYENAHEFTHSLSLSRCSSLCYYRWADTGPIWTRTSTTARRLRLPNNCNYYSHLTP
jgi:hypothetical protein